MTKTELADNLLLHHKKFTDYILSLNEEEFVYAAEGKWSAGQQLEHIRRAIAPLNLILFFHSFIIKSVFGKANRQTRTYDELVAKYTSKLKAGGRASGRFVPPHITADQMQILSRKVGRSAVTLTERLRKYSESDLDKLILPHPLLGKVTLREMMYFTIYHVQHHEQLIKAALLARFPKNTVEL